MQIAAFKKEPDIPVGFQPCVFLARCSSSDWFLHPQRAIEHLPGNLLHPGLPIKCER